MLVHLDPGRVDCHCCEAVLSHVRGRLVYTTVATFVRSLTVLLNHPVVDCIPPSSPVLRRLLPERVSGVSLGIDSLALVWHHMDIVTLAERIEACHGETVVVYPGRDPQGDWFLLLVLTLDVALNDEADGCAWTKPLPPMQALLERKLPSIADIFCAVWGICF